jgi:glycosyltransferase involved in cell wall biosynthesis
VDVIAAARSPVAGLYARRHDQARVPRLTFAGRFCEDKGPDVLVEALALLRRDDLSVYLLGDGPLRASLIDRTRGLGLADRVFLQGWVDKPWTYIAGSAVHVVPSREEAWSQSAVLALGLGVPVIGTRVDGLAETLSNSRGLLVAPDDPTALADAISHVLAGHIALDRAGAMRYARQFTATRVASFYFAEYRAMLSEQSRVGR